MDDTRAMERAIALARAAAERGNPPFGSVIVRDGEVVAEGANGVKTDLDPTAHAETVAIREACRKLGSLELAGCTIYASGEPCWMCSTVIRDVRISRVVFAATSRWATGGSSSPFAILREGGSDRFGPPPEVVGGLLADRVEALLAEVGWP